jgi:hypothetical protein
VLPLPPRAPKPEVEQAEVLVTVIALAATVVAGVAAEEDVVEPLEVTLTQSPTWRSERSMSECSVKRVTEAKARDALAALRVAPLLVAETTLPVTDV